MIEVRPTITSTSDSPEQIQEALKAAGYEPEPASDKTPEGESTPPTDPPAAVAPKGDAETGETEAASEADDDQEHEEAVPGTPAKPRQKSGRDRKIERLTREKGELSTARARAEGELAELRRQVEAQRATQPPKEADKPVPVVKAAEPPPALKRPVRPTLASCEYDQEAFDAAVVKYDDDLDTYLEAKIEENRQKTLQEIDQKESTRSVERQQQETQRVRNEQIAEVKTRHPDFEALVVNNDAVEVSGALKAAFEESEHYWDNMYWLGAHPEEAKQIFDLTRIAEGASGQEILTATRNAGRYAGMIEREILAELGERTPAATPPKVPDKPPTRVSNAPEPARPLRGAAAAAGSSRDPGAMNAVEYRLFMASPEGQAWRKGHNAR